jgi:hypothetical protein
LAQNDLRSFTTVANVYHQQPAFHGANAITTIAVLVNHGLLQVTPTNVENFSPPTMMLAPTANVANAAIQSGDVSLATDMAALQTQMQEMLALMCTTGQDHRINQQNKQQFVTLFCCGPPSSPHCHSQLWCH